MEILTILLSSLIGLFSSVGVVSDTVAERAIRDRFESVDQLEVRIDNAPSYQLLRGRVNQVRIAGQGFVLVEDFRVDTIQVETDAIDVNLDRLRDGELVLNRPLNLGVQLVFSGDDLNQVLRSPSVVDILQSFDLSLSGDINDLQENSTIVGTQIDLLENNRIRIQADFQDSQSADRLTFIAETGLTPQGGSQIQLVDPVFIANDDVFTSELEPFIQAISQGLDLRNLDRSGITARIIKLEVDPVQDKITLAALIHLDPSAEFFRN